MLSKEETELLCMQVHLGTNLPEGGMLLLSFEALNCSRERLQKP